MQNAQQQQGQEVVNREGIQLSTLSTPQTTNTISVSANEYPDLITQVHTEDQAGAPARGVGQASTSAPTGAQGARNRRRGGWTHRLRSLLCCFIPALNNDKYRRWPEDGGSDPRFAMSPLSTQPSIVIGPLAEDDKGKKTLVLDLDETLVHSSFKPVANPDYVIPVEIDGKVLDVYVLKRPFLDEFMEKIGPKFEVIVFTASLAKYADPLLDLMDITKTVKWRLFREACFPYEGSYVKDLLCLGRDLSKVIIVDNSPHSYIFQPDNAVPVSTFISNPEDTELVSLLQVLEDVDRYEDVREGIATVLGSGEGFSGGTDYDSTGVVESEEEVSVGIYPRDQPPAAPPLANQPSLSPIYTAMHQENQPLPHAPPPRAPSLTAKVRPISTTTTSMGQIQDSYQTGGNATSAGTLGGGATPILTPTAVAPSFPTTAQPGAHSQPSTGAGGPPSFAVSSKNFGGTAEVARNGHLFPTSLIQEGGQ